MDANTAFGIIIGLQTVQALLTVVFGHGVKNQYDSKLEKIRQEYDTKIDALQRRDTFRLAGLDKRLEVHQQAFTLAIKMTHTIHDDFDTKNKLAKEFYDFWDGNCLYLANESRKAFRQAINNYAMYKTFLESWRMNQTQKARDELVRIFDEIMNLTDIIAQDVDLEAMGTQNLLSDNGKLNAFGVESKKS